MVVKEFSQPSPDSTKPKSSDQIVHVLTVLNTALAEFSFGLVCRFSHVFPEDRGIRLKVSTACLRFPLVRCPHRQEQNFGKDVNDYLARRSRNQNSITSKPQKVSKRHEKTTTIRNIFLRLFVTFCGQNIFA